MPATMDEARRPVRPGRTIVGVIGTRSRHSLSPLLHNTAFAALGLDWVSLAFGVAPGAAAAALAACGALGIAGLSVTMPHKADVAALVDECSDVARRLGAVNCVVNRGGCAVRHQHRRRRVRGLLAPGRRFDSGRAGGASSSGPGARPGRSCWPWPRPGRSEVVVVNRTPERAEAAAALAGGAGRWSAG